MGKKAVRLHWCFCPNSFANRTSSSLFGVLVPEFSFPAWSLDLFYRCSRWRSRKDKWASLPVTLEARPAHFSRKGGNSCVQAGNLGRRHGRNPCRSLFLPVSVSTPLRADLHRTDCCLLSCTETSGLLSYLHTYAAIQILMLRT